MIKEDVKQKPASKPKSRPGKNSKTAKRVSIILPNEEKIEVKSQIDETASLTTVDSEWEKVLTFKPVSPEPFVPGSHRTVIDLLKNKEEVKDESKVEPTY